MERIFAVECAGKSFGTRTVLRAASIWGSRGRITALFGRNGCGKSTLLKIGAGVLKADHGAVRLHGRCYVQPRLEVLARAGLYYLPEYAALPWTMALEEIFRTAAMLWGIADYHAAVDRLHLKELLGAYPYELSGGEQRRAAIALACIREPDVLLADEPFSGVAPLDAEIVGACLRDLTMKGASVIVTGHEVPVLLSLADDIVWMSGGSTHGIGSQEDALRHDQFRREYLGISPGASASWQGG